MKPTNILLALSLVLSASLASHAQVGIGTSSPNATAELDVSSTTKGFLPPRMTTTQRNAISSPAVGLVIFNTTTNCLNFYVGLWIETCGTSSYPTYSVFCTSGAAAVVDVVSTTGKTWMDRNLGASQVATSSTDANSYGDLYQWGRRSDGHQCRNSSTTSTLSSVDEPVHGSFITASSGNNYDWRSGQNANLWQYVSAASTGVNNPCPSGYRIPTSAELEAERATWGGGANNSSTGAFASLLKLPLAGNRDASSGSLTNVGTIGEIHSSTINGIYRNALSFSNINTSANTAAGGRAFGSSVRCIKN